MRIRSIKPEFWEDEKIAALSPMARLLFIASWQLADRNGVFEHREAWIRAKVFPYQVGEAPTVSQLLHELFTGGHLVPYEVEGKKYIMVRTFAKHQRISGKEAESAGYYPLPPKDLPAYNPDGKQLGSNWEATETAGAGSREQGKEQGAGKGSGEGTEPLALLADLDEVQDQPEPELTCTPEQIYDEYPRKVGRDAAIRSIAKTLKSKSCRDAASAAGDTPDVYLFKKSQNFALYVSQNRAKFYRGEECFVPHPATWFNAARYLDEDFVKWEAENA